MQDVSQKRKEKFLKAVAKPANCLRLLVVGPPVITGKKGLKVSKKKSLCSEMVKQKKAGSKKEQTLRTSRVVGDLHDAMLKR